MPMPWLIASREERMRTGSPLMRISPAVGFVEAVEDRHQRRFAGAVLADDAVDDAALDDEIDVLVGVNRAEALVDADEFDGGSGCARPQSVTPGSPVQESASGGHASTALRARPSPSFSYRSMGEDQCAAAVRPRASARGRGTGRRPVERARRTGSSYVGKTCGPEAGSHRALVVGHVVVHLDLAGDDVGLGGVRLRLGGVGQDGLVPCRRPRSRRRRSSGRTPGCRPSRCRPSRP